MTIDPLLSEGWIVASHAFMALAAFALGLWQLAGPKGTTTHRKIGYTWAVLMLGVAIGSFWIHDLQLLGPFSPIHLLSVIVLINVPLAVLAARRGNIKTHRASMISLFVFALIVAGAFTLLPGRVMHHVVFGVQ